MVATYVLDITDEVVSAARGGDDEALNQLWDACSPILRDSVKYLRPGSGLDAGDLIQEAAIVFLDAVRGVPKVDVDVETGAAAPRFAVTLARSLRWRLYNVLRRERRRSSRYIPTDDQALELALARAASGGTPHGPPGRQLTRALECLSPRQRAVVNGLYFRDLAVAELSRELAVSPQAVTALHRRALERLRGSLGPDKLSAE